MRQLRFVSTLFAGVIFLSALTLLFLNVFFPLSTTLPLGPAAFLLSFSSAAFLLYVRFFSFRRLERCLAALALEGCTESCPPELEGVRQRLLAQQSQLEYRVRDLKTLNSYISHEMKNSLNVLTAKVELGEDRESLLEYLKRMAVTIEDILILSEVRSEPSRETTDLAMVCALVVDDYRRTRPDITFDLPADGVDMVPGREQLYYRAVSNLLDNAVKYGDESPISLTLSQAQGCISLRVKNGGSPLTAHNLENIFDPNYRLSSLKKNSYGIGLSLVKNVAELSAGTVWAENSSDNSTCFYLVIPIWKGDPA